MSNGNGKRLTRGLTHGLTTACCADTRLHNLLPLIDDGESYRKRDIGVPSKFIIDQSDLSTWHLILTGFPECTAPVSDALILAHTDCLAVRECAYFRTLLEKRRRCAMNKEGDFEFCARQLERIRDQTTRLKGVYPIHWHFGTIDTDMAELLAPSSTLEEAIACIRWPFGMPAFFEVRLEEERALRALGHHPLREPVGSDTHGVHRTGHGHIVTS